MKIPQHLQSYLISQDTLDYTPEDQAVWRFTLRQLTTFLKNHAHPFYLEGLKKTGITIDKIPKISDIDQALQKIAWQARPVSGFIPPSIFMELQSCSILPIAAEIRNIKHILYTPSPDIIHEAAGHAPFLAQPEYSQYLKSYAKVAKKALLSSEDLNLYKKIRILSDLKENLNSTATQIQNAEEQLQKASDSMSFVSEASHLGRMNWWTAEYALFGDINNPKILGAGLLSSILESESCLKPNVKKIPLSKDCLNYTYDITKPQPQLFVAKDFNNLEQVLDCFSKDLAYSTGGEKALQKAKQSQLVNTVELNSGLQISGKLIDSIYCEYKNLNKHIFLKFDGPTQLSYKDKELQNHNKTYHSSGYSSPLGSISKKNLSAATVEDLKNLNIELNKNTNLCFDSGVQLSGLVKNFLFVSHQLLIITFENCSVKYKDQVLFDPGWGTFDLAVGEVVRSVFSGPADSQAYNVDVQFNPKKIIKAQADLQKQNHFLLYQGLSEIRKSFFNKQSIKNNLEALLGKIKNQELHWLILIELYELSLWSNNNMTKEVLDLLNTLNLNTHDSICVKKALSIAKQI